MRVDGATAQTRIAPHRVDRFGGNTKFTKSTFVRRVLRLQLQARLVHIPANCMFYYLHVNTLVASRHPDNRFEMDRAPGRYRGGRSIPEGV
jgi:hypothetical protein